MITHAEIIDFFTGSNHATLTECTGQVSIIYTLHACRCAGKHIHDELATADSEQSVAIADKFEEECLLLSKLSHPNIVLFMGVHFKEGKVFPALLMELLPMSLDEALTKYHNMPAYTKNVILHDVACGLSFLHGKDPPILHRDLSSRNILLTESFHAKIADLGVARFVDKTALKLTTLPGTPVFMPPEAFPDNSEYGTPLDMFSYGVLILSTVTQKWPTPDSILSKDRVAVKEVVRRKKELDEMGEAHSLRQFTECCLSDNAVDRPDAVHAVKKLCGEVKNTPRAFVNVMEMTQHLEGLSGEITDMTSNVAALQREKEELEREVAENKNARVRLQMENAMLNEEITAAQSEIKQLGADISAKEGIIRRKDDVIAATKTEKAALQERAGNKVRPLRQPERGWYRQ